jgi:hypothetical protein
MKDLTGQRYGRLVVLEFAGQGANWNSKWRCRCDCGGYSVAYGNNLRRGLTTSCGCYHRERAKLLATTHGQSRPGQWTPEYRTWASMLTRCGNPNSRGYATYGGRGVAVCERWRAFENFFSDMGPRPTPSHSIDRIDNSRGYEPGNCRRATAKEQGRNKTNNAYVDIGGRRLVLAEACDLFGISHSRVRGRIRAGWPEELAVTTPVSCGVRLKRVLPTSKGNQS